MNGIPIPPPGYWVNVPWWAYLGFALTAMVVGLVIGPWAVQRARGAPSATLSREQALAARDAALNAREAAERARLESDRDRGWDLARGWAAVAHPLWHDLNNAVARANLLLLLFQRVLDGKMPKPAAQAQLADYQPLPAPAPLPDIEAVHPKKPGETKYA